MRPEKECPRPQEHGSHFSAVIPSLFLSGLKGFLLPGCSSSGPQWVLPALERLLSDNPSHNPLPRHVGVTLDKVFETLESPLPHL